MIGTDFESLITSHDQTDLFRLSVLKQTGIARAPFFPLVTSGVKSEKLCTPKGRKAQQCSINDEWNNGNWLTF